MIYSNVMQIIDTSLGDFQAMAKGHWGHKGRKGKRGGSLPKTGHMTAPAVRILKSKYGTNSYRLNMVDAFEEEFPHAIQAAGVKSGDVEEIYIYGSFASSKTLPGDMDTLCVVKGDLPKGETLGGPGGGAKYDANSWGEGHTASVLFVNDKRAAKTILGEVEFEAKGDYDSPVKIL